ncbi:hypothetical protein B5M42_018440 [Paenibacillus athensensis]|uniref:Uncharacterized protein n=1 Tax=Paenibacillus athensensis TaxID=1967502 RepID=A0A4Y8Q4P8_9BACL|nr:hypothetical protein [Paenibacillus athensensis]MCD1260783.1 hypothetical protein [Paenibacillus athensensis]
MKPQHQQRSGNAPQAQTDEGHQSTGPSSSPVSGVMRLQQTIGNRAVTQMFRSQAGSPAPGPATLQRKMIFESGTEYLDATKNTIPSSAYNRVQEKAAFYYNKDATDLTFKQGATGGAAAFFTPTSDFAVDGTITVKPLTEHEISNQTTDYHNRLIEVAHETHHAIDHCEDLNLKHGSFRDKVISEFRTFAVQSAVAAQINQGGRRSSDKYEGWQQSLDPDLKKPGDSSKNGFAPGNYMFETLKSYLNIYDTKKAKDYDDTSTAKFIADNQGELDRALEIYKSLKNNTAGEHDEYLDTETYEELESTQDLGGGVTLERFNEQTRQVRKPIPKGGGVEQQEEVK